MERMNRTRTDTGSDDSLNESRFKTVLSLFRLGGIPLNRKTTSAANAVYSASIIICFYVTTLCLYMDSYVHRSQLVQAMKKIRILVGMQLITWTHFSLR
jgi:hypothetical protein